MSEHVFRILVLGDLQVGKTSYFQALTGQPLSKRPKPTIGCQVHCHLQLYSDTRIFFEFYEIGGSKSLREASQIFLDGQHYDGFILVFDLTNNKSLYNLTDHILRACSLLPLSIAKRLRGVLKEVGRHCRKKQEIVEDDIELHDQYPVLLLATKKDILLKGPAALLQRKGNVELSSIIKIRAQMGRQFQLDKLLYVETVSVKKEQSAFEHQVGEKEIEEFERKIMQNAKISIDRLERREEMQFDEESKEGGGALRKLGGFFKNIFSRGEK